MTKEQIQQAAFKHANEVISIHPGSDVTFNKRILYSRITDAFLAGSSYASQSVPGDIVEKILDLLVSERNRAVNIAYSFMEQNEKAYKERKSAGSEVAFVKADMSNECRLVGNAISGLTALSHPLNQTIETEIKRDYETKLRELLSSQPVDGILRLDKPFSLKDILVNLTKASEYLLKEKNYDGPDHEEIAHCIIGAKEVIESISANPPQSSIKDNKQ